MKHGKGVTYSVARQNKQLTREPLSRKFRFALTLANATVGNESQASSCSSPSFPKRCPRSIRAAVAVETPIPSPTNKSTFLACGLRSVAYCKRFLSAVRACSYQYSWSITNMNSNII